MTAPELMRAWRQWWRQGHSINGLPYWEPETYPLYIGAPHDGRWYVRERLPGTRVWRAEEDGSFVLLDAFDMPPRLASAGSLRGCQERDW